MNYAIQLDDIFTPRHTQYQLIKNIIPNIIKEKLANQIQYQFPEIQPEEIQQLANSYVNTQEAQNIFNNRYAQYQFIEENAAKLNNNQAITKETLTNQIQNSGQPILAEMIPLIDLYVNDQEQFKLQQYLLLLLDEQGLDMENVINAFFNQMPENSANFFIDIISNKGFYANEIIKDNIIKNIYSITIDNKNNEFYNLLNGKIETIEDKKIKEKLLASLEEVKDQSPIKFEKLFIAAGLLSDNKQTQETSSTSSKTTSQAEQPNVETPGNSSTNSENSSQTANATPAQTLEQIAINAGANSEAEQNMTSYLNEL